MAENISSTHPQTQSAFFSSLPLEIRLLIYSYAIPSEYVVLDKFETERLTADRGAVKVSYKNLRDSFLSPILLSCRRMYQEAADIPVKNVRFSINLQFGHTNVMPSPSFASRIRRLEVLCDLTYFEAMDVKLRKLAEICSSGGQLKDLRLVPYSQPYCMTNPHSLKENLEDILCLRDFGVVGKTEVDCSHLKTNLPIEVAALLWPNLTSPDAVVNAIRRSQTHL
ncbi:hypothetical protein NA57DRAFT_71917 [Rhizodiscina lignyota]|uniref:DUF7730 domain-containing protein n=1 Tax=Rhizodiscina lignyota TaxID=1504668 RepID=A0A9P4IN10_9PEZI|nr:hypothetical protein NA57DRAFT_71917 [Rhizodiscina lignyota]